MLRLERLHEVALRHGLTVSGAAASQVLQPAASRFRAIIEQRPPDGLPSYLAKDLERRLDPKLQRKGTQSVIVFGMPYRTKSPPPFPEDGLARGRVAAYSVGLDYHREMRRRIELVVAELMTSGDLSARRVTPQAGKDPRGEAPHFVVIDTAPVLEKPWAEQVGLGWQGKHTNLVSRKHGSWLLLGAILTPDHVEESEPHTDHCGSCTACLTACPTEALTPNLPYQLDISKCISFLTIELRKPIPTALRTAIGTWLFGCDLCLDCCPFNRFAEDEGVSEQLELFYPRLIPILEAGVGALDRQHSQSAWCHASARQWHRNAAVVAGNRLAAGDLESGERQRLIAVLEQHARPSGHPLVRPHAQWALDHR